MLMYIHPKIVQELLGHNQISMTMDIYSHALPTMQGDAMSQLNEALREHEKDEDLPDDDEGLAGARVPGKPKSR